MKNQITLPEDDPAFVTLMMQYFYQLDYCDLPSRRATSSSQPEEAVAKQEALPGCTEPLDTSLFADPFVEEQSTPLDIGPLKGGKKKKKHTLKSEPRVAPNRVVQDTILGTHVEMYAMADKYNIRGLKMLAEEKFARAASQYWNNEELPAVMRSVYSTTPDSDTGLRSIVVKTIAEHMGLFKKLEVESVIRNINGLAFDLLKYMVIDDRDTYSGWGKFR